MPPEDAARNALRTNPESSEGLTALAFAYGEDGQQGDAILKRLVWHPIAQFAWATLGYSYYYAGLNQLAEQAWGRVVTLSPTPQPNWMHARMLLYSGKGKDGKDEMRSVVASNPDQFKALAYLGVVLYYEGKLDDAEANMDRAVLLGRESKDDSARLLAGFLCASRGKGEDRSPSLPITPRTDHRRRCGFTGRNLCLLGERQPALDWPKRTVARGNVNYPWSFETRTTTICVPIRSTRR